MFCRACGKQTDDSAFCKLCGAPRGAGLAPLAWTHDPPRASFRAKQITHSEPNSSFGGFKEWHDCRLFVSPGWIEIRGNDGKTIKNYRTRDVKSLNKRNTYSMTRGTIKSYNVTIGLEFVAYPKRVDLEIQVDDPLERDTLYELLVSVT